MRDDYDRTVRIYKYSLVGIAAGTAAGLLGGIAAQEYLNGAAGTAQIVLDASSGMGGAVLGAVIGYTGGTGIGALVNKILEEKPKK